MGPTIQRQIKRGVAGIGNIQASCGQQSGNCISEYNVIAFFIYLSLMISNCSCERSFSKLQCIKSQVRSCMTQAAKQP